MRRVAVLEALVPFVGKRDIVVTNLGMIIYEWESLNPRPGNFYMWHSLGLATSIGLGCALGAPDRTVWVLEGDGGMLVNLGSLATLATLDPPNLRVLILDNSCYEACGRAGGAHPTATAQRADLARIAEGAGIGLVSTVDTPTGLIRSLGRMDSGGTSVLVARTQHSGGERSQSIRLDPLENKYRFVRWIEDDANISILPRC